MRKNFLFIEKNEKKGIKNRKEFIHHEIHLDMNGLINGMLRTFWSPERVR